MHAILHRVIIYLRETRQKAEAVCGKLCTLVVSIGIKREDRST